jgi:hypothetical protein
VVNHYWTPVEFNGSGLLKVFRNLDRFSNRYWIWFVWFSRFLCCSIGSGFIFSFQRIKRKEVA